MSVCTGARLLAKAGLLDGLRATTHHENIDELRGLAPAAIVTPDERFTDNGKICTSGGITAGIDLSLHVVARLLGAEAADAAARYMEYERRA
jgi:transcriptional regulator GlxA family with amidase domain